MVLVGALGPDLPGHTVTPPSLPARPAAGPSPSAMAAVRVYLAGGDTDPTLLSRLAATSVPALLVRGENDPILPPAATTPRPCPAPASL